LTAAAQKAVVDEKDGIELAGAAMINTLFGGGLSKTQPALWRGMIDAIARQVIATIGPITPPAGGVPPTEY
jgi:hypothetical protein